MRFVHLTRALPLLLAGLLLVPGCGDDKKPLAPDESVPDFALQNVNPNSGTYNHAVSPRGYLGSISAWYFGHAT